MISTLFRLTEPTPGSSIAIDGVNILSIGLHELRSVIGVIPQDPVLFRGTLRQNLNPDGNDHRFDDYAIWKAVKEAHLDDVAKSGGGLDSEVNKKINRILKIQFKTDFILKYRYRRTGQI